MVKDMLFKRFDLTKDLRNLLNFAKSFMEKKSEKSKKESASTFLCIVAVIVNEILLVILKTSIEVRL